MTMKVSRTMVLKIVIGLLIVLAVSLASLYLLPFLRFIRYLQIEGKKSQQRQVRLLSETDHPALLEACREVSQRVTAGGLAPVRYFVRWKPDPEISWFPQLILDLEPTRVDIDSDGCVRLEMHGGYHHFGVVAYPEDYYKESFSNFHYGDRKLIDGLWYYDDGYAHNPEGYEGYGKGIEALLQERNKHIR